MFKFNPIKARLTNYYQNNEFDLISQLPNFKVIEKRDYKNDKENKRDCIWYTTSKKSTEITGLFSFSDWIPANYCHVARLMPNDLVIYHAKQSGESEKHIGIYKGKGKVESKFGYGHVYIHPLHYVPRCFGSYVSFFTPQKDKTIGNCATIANMEKWIELYGAICSTQIDFSNEFPRQRKEKFLEFINNNPNFLMKSSSFSMNLETKISNSRYIYRVKPDFLLDVKKRKMLIELYNGQCSSLENEEENEKVSTEVSSHSSSFSYSLHDAMIMLAEEDKLTFEVNNEAPKNFKRLRRHSTWYQEHTIREDKEKDNQEEKESFSTDKLPNTNIS